MDQPVGSGAEVVGVDLQVERKPLHPLLGREVRAQRVDADVHLEEKTAPKRAG